MSSNKKVSSLTIDPIIESSGGNYSCVVSNANGRDHFSVVLLVIAPQCGSKEPEDADVIENQNLDLKCTASGSPNPQIMWRKINHAHDDEFPSSQNLKTRNGSLLLEPVLKFHEGHYTCSADNGAGQTLKKTVAVTVRDFPKIQPFQFPQYIQIGYKNKHYVHDYTRNLKIQKAFEGEHVSIHCVATGFPPPNIRIWKLDEAEMKYFQNNVNGSLSFKPVHKSHEGKFSCEADNGVGSPLRKIISLVVHVPPSWIKEPQDVETVEGHKSVFICLASGSPSPKVMWRKIGMLEKETFIYQDFIETMATELYRIFNPTSRRGRLLRVRGSQWNWREFDKSSSSYSSRESQDTALPVSPEHSTGRQDERHLHDHGGDKRQQCTSGTRALMKHPKNNIVTTISKSNQSTANAHLLLNHVLKSHSGKYVSPVQWVSEPVNREVLLGENVKFSCSASGFPAPTIKMEENIR
ncbi:down syndrome cell adhesion molecule-like protein Dscam2 [Caerostris extrusa]|uniref:Down syndrome cell adhesion molecule-like protein Dscam2 n=1 Tax=Caerostris extrusa TaxID=172846 RepID=A0AAV4XZ87_CAEEX|nr:down syndrome cell adhesion molecule-like protein Dscam2 [Caerostris extrusa]